MSSTAETTDRLLAEFQPPAHADWVKAVEAELKGAPFDKRMFKKTCEGITLKSLYTAEDVASLPGVRSLPGFPPYMRGAKPAGYRRAPWAISQEMTYASPTEFNLAARNSIGRGLNALNIVLDKATRRGVDPDWARPEEVGLGGLSIATVNDFGRALDGINLGSISLFVRSGASALPFAALLMSLARRRGTSFELLHGCVEMDPLGVLAAEGALPQSMECAYREMAVLTRWVAAYAPNLQTICVHSRAWYEAGASITQELAYTLAAGTEYLRQLHARGVNVNQSAGRMRFAISIGPKFFFEVAKLRALRMLWAKVVGEAGGTESSQRLSLHVRTGLRAKTGCDPHNNLVRSTLEALAGVLGGSDSMQVGAFDEVLRRPDDFSQRLARNTQLILQKECHLDQVIDALGGSYYVESLTHEYCQRAWELFREVENAGGLEAALRAGLPQNAIARVAQERARNVAFRRDSIVGVNHYANPMETAPALPVLDNLTFHRRRVQQVTSHRSSFSDNENDVVLVRLSGLFNSSPEAQFDSCIEALSSGATLGEVTRILRMQDVASPRIEPLCLQRAATPFELLRKSMMCHAAGEGAVPKAFLCTMGPPKEHRARAEFSRSFLAAGGFDAIYPQGFTNAAAAAKAFAESKSQIVVICSTDENYPALVPELCIALRKAVHDAVIVLAGYPADHVDAFTKAGVDEFIHLRADACELLGKLHRKARILQ